MTLVAYCIAWYVDKYLVSSSSRTGRASPLRADQRSEGSSGEAGFYIVGFAQSIHVLEREFLTASTERDQELRSPGN